MNRLLIVVVVAGSALRAEAHQEPDSRLHRAILAGVEFTFRQEYASADSVFRGIVNHFPEHPAGYLFQAGLLQTLAMDYERDLDSVPFDSLIGLAKKNAGRYTEQNPASPWGHFFLASALGYESYARVYRGDWLGGTLKAVASAAEFKRVLALDSTFYDALVGIGTYYYWKSRKTEFLHWLPFVSDDREEGIRLLERAVEKGTYNRFPAINALVSIHLDAGNHGAAQTYALQGLERYPENRLFLWGLASAFQKQGKLFEAGEVYRRILQTIADDPEDNLYNEIACRMSLAAIERALGREEESCKQVRVVLSHEGRTFSSRLRERAARQFARARRFLRELEDAKGGVK